MEPLDSKINMKKISFYLILIFVLQSCHVPVNRDYKGLSGALVFTQNKKWLINNIYSDLNSVEREKMNVQILNSFNSLSKGNATSIDEAVSKNLLPAKISLNPDLEQLESLKNNSDFDYLVNVRTKKVADQIASLELSQPYQFSKNEAYAILEVYDLKTSKKIYSQKASSETSMEGKKTYPEYSAEQLNAERANGKTPKGPFFSYSADALSKKNLNQILKDIQKKAVK